MAATFDVAAIRKHFPALEQNQVYFDNAGGSQVLKEVIDASVSSFNDKIVFRITSTLRSCSW